MHARLTFLLAALLAVGCAPPRDPVESWVEVTFGIRKGAGTPPSGSAAGGVDLADFKALSSGATSLRLAEAELQVLEFDLTTPTQLASGELGLATSETATPVMVLPFKDLPVGENGKKLLSVSTPEAAAPLLGKDAMTVQLRFSLDDTPARFNLLTRLRLVASFD